MPRLRNAELPRVSVSMTEDEITVSAKHLQDAKMPAEAMVEALVYLKREREKADALLALEAVLRERLKSYYEGRNPSARETVRTKVGIASYSNPSDKVRPVDRDTVFESLTDEQRRISYVPDMKVLQTILKSDAFERLVTREKGKPTLTIKDSNSGVDYDEIELDF